MEEITKQGERTDLENKSTSVESQLRLSRSIVAEMNNVKDNEIQRYVRLTYLLEKVDRSVVLDETEGG